MARIREGKLKFNAGASVKARLSTLNAAKYTRRLEEEARFQRLVTTENISLEDQLNFRQDQLRAEQDLPGPDQTYLKEIKNDIASLKAAVRDKAYRDEYYRTFDAWKQGRAPLDDHIDFLERELGRANDPKLRSEIAADLSARRIDRRNIDNAVLDNFVTFAENDKTEATLNEAIGKVQSARAKALLANDEQRVSVLDLKAQSLRSSLAAAKIERQSHRFDVQSLKSVHPVRRADEFQKIIESSEDGVPVTVDGVSYASERDYWTRARDKYINDGGFVKDYNSYYGSWVDATVRTNPDLAVDVIGETRDSTSLVLARPEFAAVREQLLDASTKLLQGAVTSLGNRAINEARVTNRFSEAAKTVERLGKMSGLDIRSLQQQILSDIAATREPAVSAIIGEAQRLFDKGASLNDAINQAVASAQKGELASTAISAEELATKKPEEVARTVFDATRELPGAKVEPVAPIQPTAAGTETKPAEKTFTEPSAPSAEQVQPVASPETAPVAPPKQATLVNPQTKERRVVAVDSPDAQSAFSEGFVLETEPPKPKEEKPVIP